MSEPAEPVIERLGCVRLSHVMVLLAFVSCVPSRRSVRKGRSCVGWGKGRGALHARGAPLPAITTSANLRLASSIGDHYLPGLQ